MNDRDKIIETYDRLKQFLIEKNNRYGNSALSPIEIFSKFISEKNNTSLNGILSRLDDKIMRIKNSNELKENDVVDIIGYLVLLCINKEWCRDLDKFLD